MTDEQQPPAPEPSPRKRHAPKRTKPKREQDLVLIADLYVRGRPLQEMADACGVSRQQIQYDLDELHDRWLKAGIEKFDLAKSKELRRLDYVWSQAVAGWERSQVTKRTVAQKQDGDDTIGIDASAKTKKGRRQMVRTEERHGPGDPRFLAIMLETSRQRQNLLGMLAQQKDPPSDPDSSQKTVVAMARELSDDELRSIAALRGKRPVAAIEGPPPNEP